MKQYIAQYNEYLDIGQSYLDSFSKSLDIKYYLTKINTSATMRDWRKNEDVDKAISVIENSNYRKGQVVKFSNGLVLDLTYSRRKGFVYFMMILTLVFRGLKFKKLLYQYLIWSALFCRENFNLKNYKITRI
jgi:hypothetical protein